MKLPFINIKSKRYLIRTTILFVCVLFLAFLLPFLFNDLRNWYVSADPSIYWDGGGDATSWSDPLNWSTNNVPVPGDSVLIDTVSTVVIAQPITISSLTLGQISGTVASVLNFSYDAISVGALTISGGSLTIYSGAKITHSPALTSSVVGTVNISVTSGDANVYGAIDLDGKGYKDGYGPGVGQNSTNGSGGASHAGYGGNGTQGLGSTVIYGSLTQPTSLGSGGGDYSNPDAGGEGGGAVKLVVSGTTTVGGRISADSIGVVSIIYGAGGGSGGSIWISSGSIEGNGNITARGGSAYNTSADGGGGSGGRVAVYYTSQNFDFGLINVNGGTAYGSAQPGGVGSVHIAGVPTNPITMQQYKLDGTTGVTIGGSTNESGFIASFQVSDPTTTDTLTPKVEIQPIGTPFNNVATHSGTPVNTEAGNVIRTTVEIGGLADSTSYHWQAVVCDSLNVCSAWVPAGNNLESEKDISVLMNTAPNVPTIPSSSYYINGQFTNYLQPTFSVVLSDPNSSDLIGYQIQLDSDLEFASPIIDYKSVMATQGVQSFTVGQEEDGGEYLQGAQDQELEAGQYYWRVKAIDDKDSESMWVVAPGTPAFHMDLSAPSNTANVVMKAYAQGVNEYSESEDVIWFNRQDPYFSWDEGDDIEGVKGYCLYLGDSSQGNPANQKGLLGTSPISTTGSTCQFITDQTGIDFSNPALRGSTWLSSSDDKYYFKVRTIDVGNNVYSGPDETNFISFNFDNTQPENVTAVSAPSTPFSSKAAMYFSWPTNLQNTASDLHSDILGFQYALNSRDTWYGEENDTATGLDYNLISEEQPYYFPSSVQNLIQLGQNTIYFRAIDVAGNFSELRTVYINYGGEAPSFTEGEEVTVTPTQNTNNLFAFSWPDAQLQEGNTLYRYYYMINTPPPASYATITSNSARYIATTQTSVSARSFPGLLKGSNTVYVVAVDESENYSSTNYIQGTFNLYTELPDSPSNIVIADSSIKDASLWRAALLWDEPEYLGTGTLTYFIQRSENGTTWETITSTTGMAYIDTVSQSKRYYWRIGTSDNSDESIAAPTYSNAVSIIPRGSYIVPPVLTSGPAVSSLSTTKATISWTTNRAGDSKIAIGLSSGNYFESEPSISAHSTEHMISLSNLKPGTQYFFKAKWTDEDGNTGESNEVEFTTEPPPVIKNVRLTNLGISSVIVNFTSKDATKVKIYYGSTTGFGGFEEVATSKLETSYSLELSGLEDGQKYYYRINSFDEEGEEYNGTILDFTTLPRPRVSNILVQQVAKTAQATLLVTWESNTSVSSIVTFYPEKNPELVKDNVEIDLVDGKHRMLLRGLLPDTPYLLQVRGRDAIGNEAVSENLRVITSSDSRPPQITGVNIEGTNVSQSGSEGEVYSQLIVTWMTDEPATSQIEFGEGSGSAYSQSTQKDSNLSYNHVVIISGLSPSKVYHLRAISKDIAGNESKSIDIVTITPKSTNSAFYLVITSLREAFNFLSKF